jgi:DNA primase
MDHIRLGLEEVAFGPKRPEFHFSLPDDRKQYLKDILLSVVTKPGPNFSGAGADNIHFYIDGHDITAAVIAEFKDLVASWDQNAARQAYRAAMDRWLKYADALGSAGYGTELQPEHTRSDELAQANPLASLVTKIGDATQGWSGHLHIMNFIDQFGLPANVSLGSILRRYNATSGQPPLTAIEVKQLTISAGRSPGFDAAFNPAVDVPRGALLLRFEAIYHDPLEDEVKALREQFEQLRDRIDQQLAIITQAVSSGGPIQRRLNTVEQQVTAARQLVEQATRDIANQEQHMTALENTLTEIKNIVRGL